MSSCTKFTAANADGSHCYHAVRLVHRVRLLRAVESCCERWGPIIHQLWDGNVVWHPSRIAGRLLMREAGLAKSSPTTEAVVSEVARFLAERRGKNPFVQRESTRNESAEVALSKEVQLEMRRALRESTYTSHDAKSIAQPTTLESKPAAQEALQRAVRLGHGGALAPLPVFVQETSGIERSSDIHPQRGLVEVAGVYRSRGLARTSCFSFRLECQPAIVVGSRGGGCAVDADLELGMWRFRACLRHLLSWRAYLRRTLSRSAGRSGPHKKGARRCEYWVFIVVAVVANVSSV